MVLIDYTNIVVDSFHHSKKVEGNYKYFLTHFHLDHYGGLTGCWRFGDIYCTPITKKLIIHKFPQIVSSQFSIIELEVGQKHEVWLSDHIKINVTFFEANHCPGSVMILFQGYFGNILHTGDFRFEEKMLEYNKALFSPIQQGFLKLDKVYYDNTFCDPLFEFPEKDQALKNIVQLIENQRSIRKKLRVLLYLDQIGKEQVFEYLSNYFKTKIVVPVCKMQQFMCMEDYVDKSIFTLEREEGWIELSMSKFYFADPLKDINMTENLVFDTDEFYLLMRTSGWSGNNVVEYNKESRGYISYMVPYSCHCNFKEIEKFIQLVKPAQIEQLVPINVSQLDKHKKKVIANGQVLLKFGMIQDGYQILAKSVQKGNFSEQHQEILKDKQKWEEIQIKLGIRKSQQEKLAQTQEFFSQQILESRKINKNLEEKRQENKIEQTKNKGKKIVFDLEDETLKQEIDQTILKQKSKNKSKNPTDFENKQIFFIEESENQTENQIFQTNQQEIQLKEEKIEEENFYKKEDIEENNNSNKFENIQTQKNEEKQKLNEKNLKIVKIEIDLENDYLNNQNQNILNKQTNNSQQTQLIFKKKQNNNQAQEKSNLNKVSGFSEIFKQRQNQKRIANLKQELENQEIEQILLD